MQISVGCELSIAKQIFRSARLFFKRFSPQGILYDFTSLYKSFDDLSQPRY